MASTKRSKRASPKYGPTARKRVERALHKEKQGTLRRGKHGHGGRVTNPKQAIAIGLSEARKEGAKVPPHPKRGRTARKRSSSARSRSRSTR